MGAIVLLFVLTISISVIIFGVLIFVIKAMPEWAGKIEKVGYMILFISLIWTGIVNVTGDFSNNSDRLIEEERIRIIWEFEKIKIKSLDEEDVDNLLHEFMVLNEQWYRLVDNELLKKQDKIMKSISYFLFAISSIFIPAGRFAEWFLAKPEGNISK